MAMAIELNIVRQTQHRVCFSSQVNMATVDIVVFTHLSKSPAKSQISNWLFVTLRVKYSIMLTPSRTKDIKTRTSRYEITLHISCVDFKKKFYL